jgi:hypothetical protein
MKADAIVSEWQKVEDPPGGWESELVIVRRGEAYLELERTMCVCLFCEIGRFYRLCGVVAGLSP